MRRYPARGFFQRFLRDYSTFSANRARLINEELARVFFARVKHTAQWAKLIGNEHFSVEGTLIVAWASYKSSNRKDDGHTPTAGHNAEVDFKGHKRRNDTHTSTTNADARPFKKTAGDQSRLCHMAHILIDNRPALVVDVEITPTSGTAERQTALTTLERQKRKACRLTVGPDKDSAIDGRIRRHAGYKVSLRVRKRIEEALGWIKTVGGLAKTKLIGQAKLAGQALICFATYIRVRMGSIGGWWDAHHV